jgi:hypothetical protein
MTISLEIPALHLIKLHSQNDAPIQLVQQLHVQISFFVLCYIALSCCFVLNKAGNGR